MSNEFMNLPHTLLAALLAMAAGSPHAQNLAHRCVVQDGVMAIPETDKHKEYVRYAEHCLKTATVVTDQETRVMLREMAAEWLKLADQLAK